MISQLRWGGARNLPSIEGGRQSEITSERAGGVERGGGILRKILPDLKTLYPEQYILNPEPDTLSPGVWGRELWVQGFRFWGDNRGGAELGSLNDSQRVRESVRGACVSGESVWIERVDRE